jgi:hypothetical protein
LGIKSLANKKLNKHISEASYLDLETWIYQVRISARLPKILTEVSHVFLRASRLMLGNWLVDGHERTSQFIRTDV